MTTDKRLEAIEARLFASDSGPWEWAVGEAGVIVREVGASGRIVLRIVAGAGADVDLVAHAWDDMRYLVGRVRALESQLADERTRHGRTAERGAAWAEKSHQRKVALEYAVKALTATVNRSRTGYDWNADPDDVTLMQGAAFEAAEAALEDANATR